VLLVCWGYFINEIEATHSSQSGGLPSLLPHRTSDVWAWPPFAVSGALRGSEGKEIEAPSPLRTVPDMGFERPLPFSSML
jgi:hypothetical protein